jgi:hypothetical protein
LGLAGGGLTPGSVVHVDALGQISDDGSDFTYDATLNQLGVVGDITAQELYLGTSGSLASDTILQLVSTDKASIFCPQMTTAQRDLIATTVVSMCIFNTDVSKYQYYDGTSWSGLGGGVAKWVTASQYATDAIVWFDGNYKMYAALGDHLSGTFLTDLGNSLWSELSDDLSRETSVTDNAVARWDGTGGDDVQNSLLTVSDVGVVGGATQLNVDNLRIDGNTISSTDAAGSIILNPDTTGNVTFPDLTISQPAYIDASGSLVSQDLSLTADVSGILPIANGGTNSSSALSNSLVMESVGGAIVESTTTSAELDLLNSRTYIPNAVGVDNRIATYDGVNSLDSSANLTFDGTTVSLTGTETITGQLNADNLRLDGNTISSTDAAGDIVLNPDTTGNVNLPDLTISQPAYIDASGNLVSQDLSLTADISGVLPIANGGSNSSSALSNSLVMESVGGAIVESTTASAELDLLNSRTYIPNAVGTGNQVAIFDGTNSTDSSANLTFDGSVLAAIGSVSKSGVGINADNLFTNGSFESGVADWTCTAGACSSSTTAANQINGAKTLDIDTTATVVNIKRCFTTTTPWVGKKAQVSCEVKSSITDLQLCSNNDSATTDDSGDIQCSDYDDSDEYRKLVARMDVSTGNEICIHVKSLTTNTDKATLDDCKLENPSMQFSELSEDTDWLSYTPTATRFGTITTALGKWRRVGDSMEAEGSFIVGTPSSSPGASIGLPSGYLIDVSKISGGSQNILGTYSRVTTSVAYYDAGVTNIMFSDAADQNSLFISKIATSNGIMQKTAGDGVSGAGMGVVFKFTVPIVGWTSANTKVITPTTSVNISKAVNNATTSMSASTQYHIGFNTAYDGFDIDGNFTNVGSASSTTYTSATYFTSPKTDTYHVKSKIYSTDIDLDAADGLNISIFVNNVEVERKNYKIEGTLVSPNRNFVIDEYVKLDKDDIVTIGFYHNSSGAIALTNGDISSNFTVVKRGSDADWEGMDIHDVTLSTSSTGDFTGGSIRIIKIFKQVTIEVQSTITHLSLSSASSASGFLPVWARPNASVLNSYHAAAAGNIYSINAQADGTLNFTYIDAGTGASSARINAGSRATMSYLAD